MATIPEAAVSQTQSSDEFTPRSSFLEHVKYDRKSNTLDIHFKSGQVHRYLFCFPATFETFRNSPDHSSFYARAIKGRLIGLPLISKRIGKEKSVPLKAATRKGHLNHGLHAERTPIFGTVERAGL